MEKLIAQIPKSTVEEIRISLSEFKGHHLVSARLYFKDDNGAWLPTKKGLTLKVEYLPDLLQALGQATKEARRAGILKE